MAKSQATIGAEGPAGTVTQVLPPRGKNRGVRVEFKCSHCGELGATRWSQFISPDGKDRARSCRCLRTAFVNKKVDEVLSQLGSIEREAIAEAVEEQGIKGGVELVQLVGIESNFTRYAVSKIRKYWRVEFYSGLDTAKRTKFWQVAMKLGIDAAAMAMSWTKAQALACFRLIKRGLATLTDAAAKSADVALYRLSAPRYSSEFTEAEYGPKALKDRCIKWALREIQSQVVTSETGLEALRREQVTLQRRAQRRDAFLSKLRDGLAGSYEQVKSKVARNVLCWPSKFTHETLAKAA